MIIALCQIYIKMFISSLLSTSPDIVRTAQAERYSTSEKMLSNLRKAGEEMRREK